MSLTAAKDYLASEIVLGPPPSGKDLHRARLAVCGNAESSDEARHLMDMLGLLLPAREGE